MWRAEFSRQSAGLGWFAERAGRIGGLIVLLACLFGPAPAFAQSEFFITGIRAEGAKGTDPLPEASIYLQATAVGFIATPFAVGYHFEAKVTREHTNTLYLEARLDDPTDLKNPFVYRTKLKPGAKEVIVRHGPVKNVKMKATYVIKIVLFEDAEYFKPVDVLEQKLKAHVDTRKKSTKVDPDYAPKQ